MSIIERAASRLKTTAAQRPAGSSELLSAAELAAQQQQPQVQVQVQVQAHRQAHEQQEPQEQLPAQFQPGITASVAATPATAATAATAAQPAPVALASTVEAPAPVVRRRVGNSGGMYIVNSPNTPDANPTSGNHSHTSASWPWTRPKLLWSSNPSGW